MTGTEETVQTGVDIAIHVKSSLPPNAAIVALTLASHMSVEAQLDLWTDGFVDGGLP